jgi:hypothetical protein
MPPYAAEVLYTQWAPDLTLEYTIGAKPFACRLCVWLVNTSWARVWESKRMHYAAAFLADKLGDVSPEEELAVISDAPTSCYIHTSTPAEIDWRVIIDFVIGGHREQLMRRLAASSSSLH